MEIAKYFFLQKTSSSITPLSSTSKPDPCYFQSGFFPDVSIMSGITHFVGSPACDYPFEVCNILKYSKSWSFFQGYLTCNINGYKQRIRWREEKRLHGSLKPVDDQHGICLVLAALFSEPGCHTLSELPQTCSLHGKKEWIAKRGWLSLFILIMNV